MNPKIISFSGMTIAVVLFFASGHMIGNQQAFAFGSLGHYGSGFGHYYGHYHGHGFDHYYVPGYPMYNPCGGGPYTMINGQIICNMG